MCKIHSPVPSGKLCLVTTSFSRPFCSPPVFKNFSCIMAAVWTHRDGEWCPGVWCVVCGGGGGRRRVCCANNKMMLKLGSTLLLVF